MNIEVQDRPLVERLRALIGRPIGFFPGDAERLPGLAWPTDEGALLAGYVPGVVSAVEPRDNGAAMYIDLEQGGMVTVDWYEE